MPLIIASKHARTEWGRGPVGAPAAETPSPRTPGGPILNHARPPQPRQRAITATMTTLRVRGARFNVGFDDCRHLTTQGRVAMALTQPQLLAAVAERAEFTKADTKRVLDELANAQKVRIGGLVQ